MLCYLDERPLRPVLVAFHALVKGACFYLGTEEGNTLAENNLRGDSVD